MNITTKQVQEAFQRAGLWDQNQLAKAGQLANRIEDLGEIQKNDQGTYDGQKTAIGNIYSMLRSQIFGKSLNTRQEVHHANNVMYEALRTLGIDSEKLSSMSASAMKRLRFDANFQKQRENLSKVTELAGRWWDPDFQEVRQKAEARGLQITPISWDDPNRVGTNSAWGDNIIDAGIEVRLQNAKTGVSETFQMPLVRSPNLQDVTADIDLKKFMLPVGNAQGKEPTMKSLEDVLKHPWELMHDPSQWPLKTKSGKNKGLYVAGVDGQARVSAQTSLLALSEKGGVATFNPTAFSYSSFQDPKDGVQPTVLTIMVTPEGTSMQVLGKRDEQSGGKKPIWSYYGGDTKLYFNENGQRAPLTAEASGQAVGGAAPTTGEVGNVDMSAENKARILYIQVPLIPEHKKKQGPMYALESAPAKSSTGVEHAIIGHGPIEGPYDENLGKGWRRDRDVPVRVTAQFAKVVTNPDNVQWDAVLDAVKAEIDAAYDKNNASRISSLVMTGENPQPWPPMPPILPM
ncbi:MAG: hypothetical protein IT384_18350 [Deltaproteobacteria bacterium]|nr:hypothetical protein [Deltaproteobacteria bacterium]